ncbi:MAG: exodeoxyribonuclease VII small subunit [Muribaculaceae bacterium]
MQDQQPITPMPESYNAALAELEAIIAKLRSDNCDIETLSTLTRRGGQLLNFCRRRLTATDEELRTILAELEQGSDASASV